MPCATPWKVFAKNAIKFNCNIIIFLKTTNKHITFRAAFLSLLLVAAFVFKAVHGLFLHHHEAHLETQNCAHHQTEKHIHEAEFSDDDCSICHFSFSTFDDFAPSVFFDFLEKIIVQTAFSYLKNEKHILALPKSLRAPPSLLS